MSNMSNNKITDGTASFAVRDKRLNTLLDILYPIGSVKITVTDTAPFKEYGFGTWQEVSKGRVLWGADDSHAAGSTIEAGLPNITGMAHIRPSNNNVGIVWDSQKGAIQTKIVSDQNDNSHTMAATNPNSYAPWSEINFDASRCSSVYGKSTTVTPPSYVVHFWQRVA